MISSSGAPSLYPAERDVEVKESERYRREGCCRRQADEEGEHRQDRVERIIHGRRGASVTESLRGGGGGGGSCGLGLSGSRGEWDVSEWRRGGSGSARHKGN